MGFLTTYDIHLLVVVVPAAGHGSLAVQHSPSLLAILSVRTASSHSWWLPRSPAFPVEYPIFVRDQPSLSRRRPPASRSLFSGSHTAQSGTGFFPLGLAMVVAAVRGEEVAAVRVRDLVRLLRGVDGVQGPQQLLLVSQELVIKIPMSWYKPRQRKRQDGNRLYVNWNLKTEI